MKIKTIDGAPAKEWGKLYMPKCGCLACNRYRVFKGWKPHGQQGRKK